MGFNKRCVTLDRSIEALKNNNLKGYYGKSDMLYFEDKVSSRIHDLFSEGKTDEQILIIIKSNMEETTNEVY
jgi:hypothetical protein